MYLYYLKKFIDGKRSSLLSITLRSVIFFHNIRIDTKRKRIGHRSGTHNLNSFAISIQN